MVILVLNQSPISAVPWGPKNRTNRGIPAIWFLVRKAIPLNILIFLQKLFRFTLIQAAKFSAKTVLMEKLLQNNSNSIDFEYSRLGKYFQSCPTKRRRNSKWWKYFPSWPAKQDCLYIFLTYVFTKSETLKFLNFHFNTVSVVFWYKQDVGKSLDSCTLSHLGKS